MDVAMRDVSHIKNKLGDLDELKVDIRGCLNKLNSLTDNNAAVEETTENLTREHRVLVDRLEAFETRCSDHDKEITDRMHSLATRFSKHPCTASDISNVVLPLTARIRTIEYEKYCSNLIISGLPETSYLSDHDTVLLLFGTLNVTVDSTQITELSRVRSTTTTTTTDKPRMLFIGLSSLELRNAVLTSKRLKSTLTAKEVNASFSDSRIYINEYLPSDLYKLLRATRDAARTKNYQGFWVRNGTVKGKKDNNSTIIEIKNLEDIERLL
ncbi:uncharacterized protein LOC107273104 [Cephus cinctus]|uniref:Uncharacterized protein LOC107273104 n=1 Tax=Cephus cinctus TaxID=211228 RepID=A0AAJ7CB46_CEPCN|nr:uncharacterized protein LOC107273104 [Cephus cinctus]